MDKIAKALKKLSAQENQIIKDILTGLKNKNWETLWAVLILGYPKAPGPGRSTTLLP